MLPCQVERAAGFCCGIPLRDLQFPHLFCQNGHLDIQRPFKSYRVVVLVVRSFFFWGGGGGENIIYNLSWNDIQTLLNSEKHSVCSMNSLQMFLW